jgi:hypothetical protein
MPCSCEDLTRAMVFLDDSHSSCFLSLLALPFGLCNCLSRETRWVVEAEMVRDCEENMRAKGIETLHHLNPCTHFNMMALLSVTIWNLCSYVRRWLYILSRWGSSLHCHCKAPRSARSNSSSGSLCWVTHTYPIQGMPNNSITSILWSPTHNWNIIGDKNKFKARTANDTNILPIYCLLSRLHLNSLFYSSGHTQLILEDFQDLLTVAFIGTSLGGIP